MPVPLTAQRGGEIIDIPVPGEGKVIRSRLFEPEGGRRLGSIVLAHGLGDSAWSDLIGDGAESLSGAGFRVLAPSLYGDDGDQRDLVDCKLTTHANDIDLVAKYIRENHEPQPVFGIGHSFGGLAMLLGKAQFDGAVMWDASSPKVPRAIAYEKASARKPFLFHWYAGTCKTNKDYICNTSHSASTSLPSVTPAKITKLISSSTSSWSPSVGSLLVVRAG